MLEFKNVPATISHNSVLPQLPATSRISSYNVFSAFLPLHYLCKIAGQAPFSVRTIKGRIQPIKSIIGIFSCIIFLSFYSCILYRAMTIDGEESTILDPVMNKYIAPLAKNAERIIISINIYLIVIFSIIHRQRIIDVFNKINEVDSGLKILNVVVSNYNLQKRVIYEVLLCVGILFGLAIIDYVLSTEDLERKIIHFFSYYLPHFTSALITVQFATFMYCLQERFKMLNDILLKTYSDNFVVKKMFWTVSNANESQNKTRLLEEPSVKVLDKVFELHHLLCEISRDINIVYGFQIVVSLMISFEILLTQIYTNTNFTGTDRLTNLFTSVYWAGIHCLLVLTLVLSCTGITEESDSTKTVLHRIRNSNSEIKQATQMYSLQLLHQKVNLTACGFFPLDCTLLYSIVGAITTYLVILIQFNMAPPQSTVSPINDNETQCINCTLMIADDDFTEIYSTSTDNINH